MARTYPNVMHTDSVKEAQLRYGSRAMAERLAAMNLEDTRFSARELGFIAGRDFFYLSTVNEDGWPYMQFRGGPKGFLKALDDRTLAYADYSGNRQYISTGNLKGQGRASLFLIDYATKRRLKVLAEARIIDAEENPELLQRVSDIDYGANVERAVVLDLVAFDWNCPQHITQRYTLEEAELILRRRDTPAP